MKGDDLVLAHIAALSQPDEVDEWPSAHERLEAELGLELTHRLLAALVSP